MLQILITTGSAGYQKEIDILDQTHISTQVANHNLITQPSSFIGREDDLIQIGEMLADSNCRLLTLVGTGGIGKTRLATQAAYEALENYADGVWMVELAGQFHLALEALLGAKILRSQCTQ